MPNTLDHLLIIQNQGLQMRFGSNLGRLAGATCWLDLLSPTTYYTSVHERQGADSQSTYIACHSHLITLLIIQNCWIDLLSPTTYYTSVNGRQGADRGSEHLNSMPNTLDHPPDHPESGSTDALW